MNLSKIYLFLYIGIIQSILWQGRCRRHVAFDIIITGIIRQLFRPPFAPPYILNPLLHPWLPQPPSMSPSPSPPVSSHRIYIVVIVEYKFEDTDNIRQIPSHKAIREMSVTPFHVFYSIDWLIFAHRLLGCYSYRHFSQAKVSHLLHAISHFLFSPLLCRSRCLSSSSSSLLLLWLNRLFVSRSILCFFFYFMNGVTHQPLLLLRLCSSISHRLNEKLFLSSTKLNLLIWFS